MALSANELNDKDRSNNPSQIYANTGTGGLLYKACATNQSYTVPQWTTLNEYFDVYAAESLGKRSARDFELKYFTIGIRGSTYIGQNADMVSTFRVNAPTPLLPRNYTPIPFCARPLTNPLTENERAQYRCRTVIESDGVAYEIWWVKLVGFEDYDPKELIIERDPVTYNEIPEDVVHQEDALKNPQPPAYTPNGTLPTSNKFLLGSAMLDCSLNASDLAEIANAVKIVKGDPSLAAINEFGIYFGIDVDKQAQIGSGVIWYKEALSLTAAHFCNEMFPRSADANGDLTLRFNHGNSDPLLLLSDTTTRV